MNWGKKIAENSIKKIIKGPYDVAGVLAFKDGERICRDKAIKLFGAFWHKADRVFFGRAADKGYGINRLCFLEFGKSQKCIHVHFVAQSIIDPIAFSAILNVLWNTLADDTAELKSNWITPIHDKLAVAEYVTKEMWRFRDDSNVINCDHQNDDPEAYTSFSNDAQARRLANHLTHDLFEAALGHVPVHTVLIRHKLNERQRAQAAKERQRGQRMASSMASLRQFLSQDT
jgi:hypothetical protein